jgi:hypothetical protein
MHPVHVLLAIVLAGSMMPGATAAVDQPIDGVRLRIVRSGMGEKLVFVSRDAGALFPAIGSPDDPGTGSPGGALIDLVSAAEGIATLTVPAGVGTPGWTSHAGSTDLDKFTNSDAPGGISVVRRVVIHEGRVLKVVARATGLALTGPQGSVGIRITTGTLRNCALFTAPTKDEADRFVARDASAAAITDCSDASLGAPTPTTTSTSLPPCSGEGGLCVHGAGCCAGLTCHVAGGPGGLGNCTSATCSGEGGVCFSAGDCCALPCCAGFFCGPPPGIPGSPYYFCQPFSGVTRCCAPLPGASVCSDIPDETAAANCPVGLAAPGLVCDGTTGTCQPTRQGVTFCCDFASGCVEGPDVPGGVCTVASGTIVPDVACLPSGDCAAP